MQRKHTKKKRTHTHVHTHAHTKTNLTNEDEPRTQNDNKPPGHSPLAEFLDRQVGALSVRSVFAPSLLEKDRDLQKLHDPSAVTFHEGDMYITDRGKHRILKVRPGKWRGEVFFGGNETGSALHQLAWPENIAFFQGQAYIADCGNDRVLEVKPGEKKGKVVFGSLKGPSDVTFFEGNAYIVEKPEHRIVKVKLGASHGEIFFGGNQSAWSSLTSLLYPQRISFYGGKAYIVDTMNARILKVTPGEKKAELFFGQKWSGDTLAQLNTPASITFFQGSAYITDAMNSRILKLAPYMGEAEVFFQGTGYLSDVAFFGGGAYVANSGMGNRILKVNPTGTEIFFGDRALLLHSSWLRSLKMHEGHAYIVDEGAGRILKLKPGVPGGEIVFPPLGTKACLHDVTFHKGSMYIVDPGCSVKSGGRILKMEPGKGEAALFFGEEKKGSSLHQLHRPSGITFFDGAAYIVDSGNHRVLQVTPGSSQGRGVGSSLRQLNRPRSIAFLESNAYIFDEGNRRVLVVRPLGLQAVEILGGGSTSFSPQVGHLVDLAFFRQSAFILDSGSAVSKFCLQRSGAVSTSLQSGRNIATVWACPAKGAEWVAHMDKVILQVQTAELGPPISPPMPAVEVALLLLSVALPSFLAHASNERIFHIICLVYLAALAWLSVRQRFLELPFDLTSFLVMKACGYEYSWLPLTFLLAALIMQNAGGLLYASFVVHKACNCRYVLIWTIMMPPWRLVDLDLEAVGKFSTVVRVLVQDFPQMAVKLHFIFTFYKNWFVMSDCAISLCVAAIDILALARARYSPTYHQLPSPRETARAMMRGDT
ncbi:pknD [Symbiodinium sp. CCMP2592]|nr:pknD [Symbiodinium sp. CCMP2592]